MKNAGQGRICQICHEQGLVYLTNKCSVYHVDGLYSCHTNAFVFVIFGGALYKRWLESSVMKTSFIMASRESVKFSKFIVTLSAFTWELLHNGISPHQEQLAVIENFSLFAALFHLGDYSHKLESLDVSWCSALSDVGARYVSEKCPRLSYLSLMRCDSVSDATVEELVKLFPRIYYSTMYLDYGRLLAQAHKAGVLSKPIKLHDWRKMRKNWE